MRLLVLMPPPRTSPSRRLNTARCFTAFACMRRSATSRGTWRSLCERRTLNFLIHRLAGMLFVHPEQRLYGRSVTQPKENLHARTAERMYGPRAVHARPDL